MKFGISWEFNPLRWMIGLRLWPFNKWKYLEFEIGLPMLSITLWMRRVPLID